MIVLMITILRQLLLRTKYAIRCYTYYIFHISDIDVILLTMIGHLEKDIAPWNRRNGSVDRPSQSRRLSQLAYWPSLPSSRGKRMERSQKCADGSFSPRMCDIAWHNMTGFIVEVYGWVLTLLNTFLKDLESHFSAEFLHWDTLDILWRRRPKAHSIYQSSRYMHLLQLCNIGTSVHICGHDLFWRQGQRRSTPIALGLNCLLIWQATVHQDCIEGAAGATLHNICAWGSQVQWDWSLSRRIFRTFAGAKWHRRVEDIKSKEGWIFRIVFGWTNHARAIIPSSPSCLCLPQHHDSSCQPRTSKHVQTAVAGSSCWDMTRGGISNGWNIPWTCSSLVCSVLHDMALSLWFV